ncbi:MAG: transposase, partial [Candidatus Tectomicrobia bacterium]|nr:transposase [Candidatus Tectomicrobia bacterium]
GTLWESRYKSSLVETAPYLLACARCIELNPVRAKMVGRPEDYPWSSCRDKLGERHTSWLDLDPCYLGLGRSAKTRAQRYHAFLMEVIPEAEWPLIRQAI